MEAGSVWVRVGIDLINLEAGVEKAKAKIGSMDTSIKSTRKEFSTMWRDIGFVALPLTIAFATISMEVNKIGDSAKSIRKLSSELNISYEAAQRLQGAQQGVYNQPIYTDDEVERLSRVSSEVYLLTNYLDVSIGKWMVWNEARYKGGGLPDFLGDVGAASLKTAKDTEALDKWFQKLGDDATGAAKKIKDAQRAIEDLSRSVEDMQYSTRGERFTQADLGTEYSSLEQELQGLDPAIYGDTATIAATSARRKEIQARMERISYQMYGSSRVVRRNTEGIEAAGGLQGELVKIIIDNKSTVDVNAEIIKNSRDQAWLLNNWGEM